MKPNVFLYFALVVIAATELKADINADGSILEVIGNPPALFEDLIKFVQNFSDSKTMIDRLSDYSVVAVISELSDELSAVAQEIRENLLARLDEVRAKRFNDFFKLKEKIDRYFAKFQNHITFGMKRSYSRSLKKDLFKNVLAEDANSPENILFQMFQRTISSERAAPFQMLADTSLTSTIECSTGLPQHFVLYNIFLTYCATEIKGAIVDLYIRYEEAKRSENELDVEGFKKVFSDALFEAAVNVKAAMWTASRSYWSCGERSVHMTEDEIQAQFGQFLQMSLDLRPIEANATENEVIVGLRFRMQAGMLSIEAKMAELLPCGHIDTESQIWKELPSFKSCDLDKLVEYEDYVKLSESRRSFVLDDVELGHDYALTGVKFVYENGFIKLAARGHKFDFKNGTIDTTQEIWIVSGKSKNETEYSELLLKKRDEPHPSDNFEVDSHSDSKKNETLVQFVKLMTSSTETDVGQSIVPFIHKVPVVPKQLLPLSGVGLIHMSNKKSGGYLALKIIGYDFEPQISKPTFYKSQY